MTSNFLIKQWTRYATPYDVTKTQWVLQNKLVSSIIMRRHQMETFSALLALCTGNSPLIFLFDLRLNKHMSKQSWGWWFETPSRPLWRHCKVLPECLHPHIRRFIWSAIRFQRSHVNSRSVPYTLWNMQGYCRQQSNRFMFVDNSQRIQNYRKNIDLSIFLWPVGLSF